MMDRRDFLKTAAMGVAAAGLAKEAFGAETFYPTKVDAKLFENINRVKDAANKTPLEKTHAPVITAPQEVKAGVPFTVEVSVGENLHVMTAPHWIEYIELRIGNEPAARVDFDSKGYAKPKAVFTVVLGPDLATTGKVTLVANQRCNLHGLWEGSADVKVSA
jgi:superoxide reductase